MKIQELDHKTICLLGFGREGRATYDALQKYAPHAKITIADANPKTTLPQNTTLITSPDYLTKLDDFDVIIKTPGISWRPTGEIAARVTSATELFLNSLPTGSRVIGITGSKGKSTTAHLIYQALTGGGQKAVLAGNIGEPMLAHLPEATPDTIFVLELSSYQLEALSVSPPIAVITSFFPDHLDYHGTLEAYREAKRHIAQFQHPDGVVFYNAESTDCRQLASSSPGHKIGFTGADFPGPAPAALSGDANRRNLAAAYLVATYCGVTPEAARNALEHATGLPHRQQALGRYLDIDWVDDAGATTPQSTLAALGALEGIDTIIVGGLDRSYDFTELGQALAQAPLRNVVLFPDTGAKIRESIEAAKPDPAKTYFETSSMDEAVAFAAAHTATKRICLLSSGAPSYNLFKNYPERGEAFQAAIKNLAQQQSN